MRTKCETGERRKPFFSSTVCSSTSRVDPPTSDMSVRLRVRKSHAGALKSDFVKKKKNDCIAVYTFFLRALNFEKIENVS